MRAVTHMMLLREALGHEDAGVRRAEAAEQHCRKCLPDETLHSDE